MLPLPNEQDSVWSREEGAAADAPAASTMAINLRDRISDLEQSLSEERRALREFEERYRELEARFNELLQKQTRLAVWCRQLKWEISLSGSPHLVWGAQAARRLALTARQRKLP